MKQMKQEDIKRLEEIIKEGNVDSLLAYAMELGSRIAAEDLGRTQIRNIYGMVKSLQPNQENAYRKLKLLIPKLKYAAAREAKLTPLADALSEGIKMVEEDEKRLKHFTDFFEAVVAYHYAEWEDLKKKKRR